MSEQNLDVNLIIQSFQEKVSALVTEVVVKDATIKQLNTQIQSLVEELSVNKKAEEKKDK